MSRLGKALAGRWGFHMLEEMRGVHEFEPAHGGGGKRPMVFRATWGTDDVREWIDPRSDDFLVHDLDGTVTIDGLCRETPCRGTLALRYFRDATIRYTFEFEAGGTRYRYVGEKMGIRPWNWMWSHTRCYGRLTRIDTGELVSTSLTTFRFRSVPRFLASLRLG